MKLCVCVWHRVALCKSTWVSEFQKACCFTTRITHRKHNWTAYTSVCSLNRFRCLRFQQWWDIGSSFGLRTIHPWKSYVAAIHYGDFTIFHASLPEHMPSYFAALSFFQIQQLIFGGALGSCLWAHGGEATSFIARGGSSCHFVWGPKARVQGSTKHESTRLSATAVACSTSLPVLYM